MDFEKMLEEELKKNIELKKLFDEYPERRELYIEKLKDTWGASICYIEEDAEHKAKYCKTCIFAHGKPPFANLPEKAYCAIYERGTSLGKPSDVYYDGAECEFYEEEK